MKGKKFFPKLERMKILIRSLVLFLVLNTPVFAQDQEPRHPKPKAKSQFWSKDRIVTGGNLGASFGTITVVDISPIIGYKITDKFIYGVGGTYMYYAFRHSQSTFKTHIYGARTFARYYPIEFLFGHAEYEWLNGQFSPFTRDRINTTGILLGGGISQRLGGSSALVLTALWNVHDDPFYPYPNPIIRGGIVIGF